MRRIFFRFAVAVTAFSVGVSVWEIYRRYTLPEVITIEEPAASPYFPIQSSCFPGLSMRVDEPSDCTDYFRNVVLSENAWSNQFRRDWYSNHLRAMEEVALTSLLDEDESYRFLWLRSFHHPITIHVWRTGVDQFIVVKEVSGAGGYKPG